MTNKSLITLVSESNDLERMLIESGGELTPEIEAMLQVKGAQLPDKVDAYHFTKDRFATLETYYKERANFYYNIAKQCGAVQDRLVENLKYAMNELHTDELVGHDVKFKLSKSKAKLVIDDPEMVPVAYKTEVITTQIEKEKLRADLEIGEVAGAHLEPSFSLRTYANTPNKKTEKAGA